MIDVILSRHQIYIVKDPAVCRRLPGKACKRVPSALEFEPCERPVDDGKINPGFLAEPKFFDDPC